MSTQPWHRRVIRVAGILILLAGSAWSSAYAQKPSMASRGFRLFAQARYILAANRVGCGIEFNYICSSGTFGTSVIGAFWPWGTPAGYLYISGHQVAGIIAADGGPWAGDTAGGFFLDLKGTSEHGQQVEPIYASGDSADRAQWPDMALVPASSLYHPTLHGRIRAADEDVWWLMWEGNPAYAAGRPHPLGILAEVRVMAWNSPSANEDILYAVTTFYNITSLDPASYAQAPSALQPVLLRQAQEFHNQNNAEFGITLPPDGYTITNLFAAIAVDPDVATVYDNYASVQLPLAMGYGWDRSFSEVTHWSFDPVIFSPPFFPGSGLVGVKLLSDPGLTVFSATENGGSFRDPQNTTQLYRYLSGTMSIASGDDPCNVGPPSTTGICYIEDQLPFDIRFFLSGQPVDLAPGAATSFAVAYVFAAPIGIGSCLAVEFAISARVTSPSSQGPATRPWWRTASTRSTQSPGSSAPLTSMETGRCPNTSSPSSRARSTARRSWPRPSSITSS